MHATVIAARQSVDQVLSVRMRSGSSPWISISKASSSVAPRNPLRGVVGDEHPPERTDGDQPDVAVLLALPKPHLARYGPFPRARPTAVRFLRQAPPPTQRPCDDRGQPGRQGSWGRGVML